MKRALLLVVLCAFGLGTAPQSTEENRPRVYVHIDPRLEEHDRAKLRDLADSVADLREQISKRPSIASAKSRSDADILVTLIDRRIEVNRSGETKYFGYTQTHYQSRYVLSFRLAAGGLDFETDTALAGAFVTWKRVAGVVAKDIEAWARANEEALQEEL
ncbi:MAG TPA: hypothetical protein VIG29_20785 [Vicinamibacteria bacterium]|jgi:hypothetical protein